MKLFHASTYLLVALAVLSSVTISAALESAVREGWHATNFHEYHQKEVHDEKKAAFAQTGLDVHGGPAAATSTLPPAHFYEDAQKVEHYLEKRRGVEFFPEGARVGVDIGMAAVDELTEEFSESPDVFQHCILMRDFATPLRVGSALNTFRRKSFINASHRLQKKTGADRNLTKHKGVADAMKKAHPVKAILSNGSFSHGSPKSFVQFEDVNVDPVDSDDDTQEEGDAATAKIKPDSELLYARGGVMDKDTDSNEAQLEVNMFAWLKSVSGEVAVIPNGIIAKWGSKKKVPIAGFLCSHEEGLTLHTLPTPCLETTLDEDGSVQTPPVPVGLMSRRPVGSRRTSSSSAPASASSPASAKAPGPAPKPASLFEEEAEDVLLALGKKIHRQQSASDFDEASGDSVNDTANGPAPLPAPAPVTAQAPASFGNPSKHYHVYVGDVLLKFSSKPKGQRFCRRLAQKIADDLGDTEWTTDELKKEELAMDMKVGTFVQMMRRPPRVQWTTGPKSLLVVIMDWMQGDRSKLPLSKQSLAPSYYKNTVMPKVAKAFRQMSYGKFTINPTVIPEIIPYTRPRSRYTAHGFPFPGLYDGAKESLAGNVKFGGKYRFEDYDLVYVVNPQQSPVGTKGVAWVGAKGAICNGCEAISENFQVMVAVHELGHNLGLSHASSGSLEYGNPFDWMGNYPDVTGLTYGLSYKYKLHWVPQEAVTVVTDKTLGSLNYRVIMRPFDGASAPKSGEVLGVKISLKKNSRDLFVAYRQTAGQEAGVYITLEDRDRANSELIDMACHTASQKDARLQAGWTYMDPSGQVVVVLNTFDKNAATVHIYSAPGGSGSEAIRARDKFTDGRYKCPRTCTDSDLLVSQFKGCRGLQREGYCRGGSITMGGKKMSIGKDLCPQSCQQCPAVLAGSTLVNGKGCGDRKVRIDGMNCRQIAIGGYCEATTNIGHVGNDLCPRSCGKCPPRGSFAQTGNSFADPNPARTIGKPGKSTQPVPSGPLPQDEDDDEPVETAARRKKCEDDLDWEDKDGDGCEVYNKFITEKRITLKDACNYNGGAAKKACRLTCKTCKATLTDETETCSDKTCVSKWLTETGQCFRCGNWASRCNESHVMADCPLTCGLCNPEADDDTTDDKAEPADDKSDDKEGSTNEADDKPCKDSLCIDGWMAKYGKCYKCSDYAEDYCGRDANVMRACPNSCKLCEVSDDTSGCKNDFRDQTCHDYAKWGWCSHREIQLHCRKHCDLCGAKGADIFANPWEEDVGTGHDQADDDASDDHGPGQFGSAAGQEVSLLAMVLMVVTLVMQCVL